MDLFDSLSLEVIVAITAVAVAGLISIVGMWVERDNARPMKFIIVLTMLILLATGVSMYQSYMDAQQADRMEQDLARMITMLDKLAAESGSPELQALIKDEISAQSRSNPDVVQKVAQRVADEGGDPSEVLGAYLPPGEVEAMNRGGKLKVKPTAVARLEVGEPTKRPRRTAPPPPPPEPARVAPPPAPEPEEAPAPAPEPPSLAAAAPLPVAAAAPRPAAASRPAPKVAAAPAPDPKKAAAAEARAKAAEARAAAAAAKEKAAEEARAKAAAAAAAQKKAADDAKKKAEEAKKKATADAKKKAEDAKKKALKSVGF